MSIDYWVVFGRFIEVLHTRENGDFSTLKVKDDELTISLPKKELTISSGDMSSYIIIN